MTSLIERARDVARVDLAPRHRQPRWAAFVLASLAALAGSLGADAALVAIGTRVFPSTTGYTHFRFSDYGELTIIGVLVACAAWPLVTRISSAPRWLFFRLAVLVTVVLWLPDIWLLARHQPVRAVAILMVMHLAIALVTYNLLVHVAVVRDVVDEAPDDEQTVSERSAMPGMPAAADVRAKSRAPVSASSRLWPAMASGVGLEFALGIATMLSVPFGRANGWLPSSNRLVYELHAIVGALLGVAAPAMVLATRRSDRLSRRGALVGGIGLAIGAAGGFLVVDHRLRLLGMALMLVGTLVGGIGYLIPLIEPAPAESALESAEPQGSRSPAS